jgi:triosephosphate isomerase
MRQFIIAGNWKMHKTNQEARQLIEALKEKTRQIRKTGIVVCPPFTALNTVTDLLKDNMIRLGAQNMHWEEKGAFTGEIAATMLKSCGVTHVIIGHSERRQFFGDTDEIINKKLQAVIASNLKPIFCVGETLQEREDGVTKDVVRRQLERGLDGISVNDMMKMIIAYEPVWAIGTGKTATPEQAEDVHLYIRQSIEDLYSRALSESLVIQYGGSVKPENASELLKQANIDGALVGGACLNADSFAQIIESAESLS